MTPLQQRFVEAYRISRNAKQAAITAGYASDSAAAIGSRCLRKPQIVAALAKIGVRIAYGVHPRDQQRKSRSAFVKRGLTLKQQRFVEQYLIDGNATQAAIRARLPSRSPSCAGARMLRRPGVAEAIRAACGQCRPQRRQHRSAAHRMGQHCLCRYWLLGHMGAGWDQAAAERGDRARSICGAGLDKPASRREGHDLKSAPRQKGGGTRAARPVLRPRSPRNLAGRDADQRRGG